MKVNTYFKLDVSTTVALLASCFILLHWRGGADLSSNVTQDFDEISVLSVSIKR
jgi:hypothetical protein